MQESTVDDTDLALIHALERSPDATWEALALSLSLDASTVKRRWKRMQQAGTAWVSCYPLISASHAGAIVEVRCESGATIQVAMKIAEDPRALFVEVTSGSADIIVTVVAPNRPSLSRYLFETLPKIPGVLTTVSLPIVQVDHDGAHESLLPEYRRRAIHTESLEPAPLIRSEFDADELDWAICLELSKDARQSARAVADVTKVGPTTVRRRIERMRESGAYRMIVGASPQVTGASIATWFSARIPPRSRSSIIAALVRVPNVLAIASVAGRNNLFLQARFRDLSDIDAFEVHLGRIAPELEIADRKVVLRPVRHMSRLLDEEGRAVETVSVDIRTG